MVESTNTLFANWNSYGTQ